jgi:hypothetical protein
MDTVKDRMAEVAALQAKRTAMVRHATELSDERAALVFEARCCYEPGANVRLGEINAALALHHAELHSVDCALNEAAKRLALAQQREFAT